MQNMNILYYSWYENSENDMMISLIELGYNVLRLRYPIQDYENDRSFAEQLINIIIGQKREIIISFDFFPIIAKVAEQMQIKYIAWVYDMPHYTLFSPSILSKWVYLFVFDYVQYMQLRQIKKENIFHMPLAVNVKRLEKLLGACLEGEQICYRDEISFVGGMYENNMFRKIKKLPDYLRGYLNGLIEAQQIIYGYDLIGQLLSGDILEELKKHIFLNMESSYMLTETQMYTDILNAEVTCRERQRLLLALTDVANVSLYTNSHIELGEKIKNKGIVSYEKQMPEVFRFSKINVNITLRSIQSGIPLRALDIMGAGGFLLSNYQPELAEHFRNGEELVLFESMEDMLQKADYYMHHDREREKIAKEGCKKVQLEFNYEKQLSKIFSYI